MIFKLSLALSAVCAQFRIEDPLFEYVTIILLSWYAAVYYLQQLKMQIGIISCVIDPSEDSVANTIMAVCAIIAGLASMYSLGYDIFIGVMLPIIFTHFGTITVSLLLQAGVIKLEEKNEDEQF